MVARDLTPSQTAAFDRTRVVAFATDLGGQTSHTAIVAREHGLPAVMATGNATIALEDGDIVTVDGGSGRVEKGLTAES